MIIVDFSAILVAKVHKLVKLNDDFDTTMYKTMVLNSVVSYKKQFGKKYGNLVFAMDSKPYWRESVFPHYKCKRAEAKKKQQDKTDHVDWNLARQVMNDIMDDLQLVFPYKVIRVPTTEADDIIGVLAERTRDPMIIISRDGDFKQLQRYPHVSQYDPIANKLIKEKNPLAYLKEHIIRGDSGDGIPNILSPSHSFAHGIKQNTMYTKNVEKWINMDIRDFAETTDILDRYEENEKLIDLTNVPENLVVEIMSAYNAPTEGSNRNIQSYLIKNQLVNLMDDLQHFIEKKPQPSLADLIT